MLDFLGNKPPKKFLHKYRPTVGQSIYAKYLNMLI